MRGGRSESGGGERKAETARGAGALTVGSAERDRPGNSRGGRGPKGALGPDI